MVLRAGGDRPGDTSPYAARQRSRTRYSLASAKSVKICAVFVARPVLDARRLTRLPVGLTAVRPVAVQRALLAIHGVRQLVDVARRSSVHARSSAARTCRIVYTPVQVSFFRVSLALASGR